jgi:hypothetical protein
MDTTATTTVLAVEGVDDRLDPLTATVVRHAGRVVAGAGVPVLAAFSSVLDAIACAIEVQQAIPAGLRIGVSVGEATHGGDRCWGPPVDDAVALARAAGSGEILTRPLVRALVASRRAVEFHAAPKPVCDDPALSIGWQRGTDSAVTIAFPHGLSGPDHGFVGRRSELASLEAALDRCAEAGCQAAFIAGEPGVGKTRLAATFARRAHDAGASVLYGRCDEDLGVAYQPFVDTVRQVVAACTPEQFATLAGPRAGELRRLLAAGPVVDRLPPLTRAEPDTERYLLFEAVVELLAGVTQTQPAVLVVDDMHWATEPTLRLLRHVVRTAMPLNVLIVVTYRDTDVDRAHQLSAMLADFRREENVERLALGGLDATETYAYLGAAAGDAGLDPRAGDFAEVLTATTGGNPFFIGEVLAHLVETGRVVEADGQWTTEGGMAIEDLGLPEGVRDIVTTRLTRLSATDNQVLAVASVFGTDVPLGALERATGIDSETVLSSVEAAMALGVLTDATVDRVAFTHAIVRQTLYSELSAARRMRLHGQVAEALVCTGDDDAQALAHHFCASALDGHLEDAVRWSIVATQQALDDLAFEHAIALAQRALSLFDLEPAVLQRERCELTILLALAQDGTLDEPNARVTARDAARQAQAIGDLDLLTRAVRAHPALVIDFIDPVLEQLYDETLDALVGEGGPRYAVVFARWVAYRAWSVGEGMNVLPDAEKALELARPSGDAEALALALWSAVLALSGSPDAQRHIELADELCVLAERHNRLDWRRIALSHRLAGCFQAGRFDEFRQADHALRDLAAATGAAVATALASIATAGEALREGRFDEVANATAVAEAEPDLYNSLLAQVMLERGQLEILHQLVATMAAQYERIVLLRAGLAVIEAGLGNLDAASAIVVELRADGFSACPRNWTWPPVLGFLAQATATVGDQAVARAVLEELDFYESQLIVSAHSAISIGAADRYRAALMHTLGQLDAADTAYRDALALEQALGAPPFEARTRTWHARLLIERDASGDRATATELLRAAKPIADGLGMARLRGEIDELLTQVAN